MSDSKPNLIVLASTFPAKANDGTPACVQDLAEQEANWFNVTVLTPMVPGAAARETVGKINVVRYRYFFKAFEDLADGAILDNLKAKKSRFLQVGPMVIGLGVALSRLVKDLGPAAIHAHWVIPQGIVASVVAPKVPLMVTTHGGDIYALNQKPLLALKKQVFAKAKHITTVNSQMAQSLRGFGLPAEKISVLPMGVDTSYVRQVRSKVTKVSGQVLAGGRLVEKKGFTYLFDAMRLLPADLKLELLVIGDGPIRAELEAAAAGLPVKFMGQCGREQVLTTIAESEVMVIPSVTAASGDQEGLPVTLLEGAAGAIAVIASNLPGINEVVVDGKTGVLTEQRDVPAIAKALEALLRDEKLRAKYAAAIEVAAAEYDIAVIGKKYSELLLQIAKA
jgi:glycosyltransferase involved in cell wall biosynthesis